MILLLVVVMMKIKIIKMYLKKNLRIFLRNFLFKKANKNFKKLKNKNHLKKIMKLIIKKKKFN